MNEETLSRQFGEATLRSQETINNSPKARKISYNSRTKRLMVELETRLAVVIPANLIQIFEGATERFPTAKPIRAPFRNDARTASRAFRRARKRTATS